MIWVYPEKMTVVSWDALVDKPVDSVHNWLFHWRSPLIYSVEMEKKDTLLPKIGFQYDGCRISSCFG